MPNGLTGFKLFATLLPVNPPRPTVLPFGISFLSS